MSCPVSAVAAVTHPDPYPYYVRLAAECPLSFDSGEGIWVAASAGVVESVLTSPVCRVRPVGDRVPEALVGTPAGEVFALLVRMNDGAYQNRVKHAVVAVLGAVEPDAVRASAYRWADDLLEQAACRSDLTSFAFALPAQVVGDLLGVPDRYREHLARWTGEFVAAIAPGATVAQIEAGSVAVQCLQEALLTARGGLVEALEARGIERDVAVANGIGFLFQGYDATAGLICQTLRVLATVPEAAEAYRRDPGSLPAIVREASRFDPPIQNTRRFVARDEVVVGQQMRAGDAILLVLAAANRDPGLPGDVGHFDPAREHPASLSFGHGSHRCPGEAIALEIATTGIERLLAGGLDLSGIAGPVEYRPSVNARIPMIGTGKSSG